MSVDNIRFSVVIPLYNKEKYIEQTLRSVLEQSYPFFEVVVVDDGSSDKSVSIVKSIKDSRIRIISQKNGGVAAARNTGIEVSVEEYVAFIDADDYWAVTYLEEMVSLISSYPDSGMYACRYAEVIEGKQKSVAIALNESFKSGYISYFKLFARTYVSPICSSAVVIPRKSFIKAGVFRVGLKVGEDIDLWLRLAQNGDVIYLNQELAFYNNDQPIDNRLSKKLYSPQESYIFSLDKLYRESSKDGQLLIDGLILRTLRPYYALGLYIREVDRVLKNVNFKNQPLGYRLYYYLPRWMAKSVYLVLRKMRSLLR